MRAALLAECDEVAYPAGAVVVRAGDPADAYYLITRGTAHVLGPRGEPLALLGPGQSFGELALLLGRPRTATVVANSPLVCRRLSAAQFEAFIQDRDRLLAITISLATRQ